MFRCAITKKMSKPGEKANKIVTATRDRIYYGWFRNEETGEVEHLEIGRGFEIVSEVNATDEGMRVWMEAQGMQSHEHE